MSALVQRADNKTLYSETPSSETPSHLLTRKLTITAVVLLAVGFLPLVRQHFLQIWSDPMYQFYPFLLAFVGFFGWRRWTEAQGTVGPRAGRTWISECSLMALAVALLALAVAVYNPWLGAVACMPLLAAAVLIGQRFRNVRQRWALWAVLLLVIPPPLGLAADLAAGMQDVSSALSSSLLDLLRVDHVLRGNIIQLPSKELFVDQACSGVVSIMSVITCAAMYCIWRRRGLISSLLLILAGIGWALAMNVVRICAIAVVESRYGMDWSHGRPHELLGLAAFLTTAVALISTDMLLRWLLAPIEVPELYRAPDFQNAWIDGWNRLTSPPSSVSFTAATPAAVENASVGAGRAVITAPAGAVLFALCVLAACLGAYQTAAIMLPRFQPQPVSAQQTIDAVLALDATALPEQIGDWKRVEYKFEDRGSGNEFGAHSHVHQYVHNKTGLKALVSLDFPFYGEWHELCRCYRSAGWKQLSREVHRADVADAQGCSYVTGSYTNPLSNSSAFLVFSLLDQSGAPVEPPESLVDIGPLWQRVLARLRRRQPSDIHRVCFQVQVFSEQFHPHSGEQREELVGLNQHSLRLIRRTISDTVDVKIMQTSPEDG